MEVKRPVKSTLYITYNPGEENSTVYINHNLCMFVILNRHTELVSWAVQLMEPAFPWIMSPAWLQHPPAFSIDEVCITTFSHEDSLVADMIWWLISSFSLTQSHLCVSFMDQKTFFFSWNMQRVGLCHVWLKLVSRLKSYSRRDR